jgi:predicted RNA-binding protein YlxR (DUF448 family)
VVRGESRGESRESRGRNRGRSHWVHGNRNYASQKEDENGKRRGGQKAVKRSEERERYYRRA